MKKTTVRFAAVGTVLLLGALAIALAQHDSRQRPRDTQSTAKSVSETPQPILVDAIEPPFHSTGQAAVRLAGDDENVPAKPLVRANDNPALQPPTGYQPALGAPPSLEYSGSSSDNISVGTTDGPATGNPLRPAASIPSGNSSAEDRQVEPLGNLEDNSAVALASGEGEASALPSGLPTLPSLPAALGAQPLPVQSGPGASPELPKASLGAEAASGPSSAPPGWVNSSSLPSPAKPAHQNLSDTQRPAMPATSLPSTSRTGQQSWLEAPAMSGSGSPASRAGGLPSGAPYPSTAGTSPAAGPGSTSGQALSPLTASPPATVPPSGLPQPAPSQSSTPRSRLSDAPEQSPASDPMSTLPTLPPSDALGTPASDGSRPPGDRPAATLGSPEPYNAGSGSSSDYYQDKPAGSAVTSSGVSGSGVRGSLPTGPSAAMPAAAQPLGQLASGNARSLLAGTALGSLVSNQPGNRHLDGSQNPIMLIQKRTAGECQVGKRATIIITVRNSGNAPAHDVQVIDSVPSGASFAEAIPAATPTPEGVLVWQLGEMAPGDERTINLQIIPERQGELGSVASVRFAAQASVRTLATLPKLELAYTAAPEVLIGSQHAVDVVVKNVGTGVARNVRLEADLPANIRHESGDAGLEASFGDIAPGESKHIRLNSIATEAGNAACSIRALTDDGLQQEQKIDVRVLAPALQATISGPSKRYLDRQANFEIAIQNTGTAPASNCEFVLRLPAGLNFNTANNHGTYDPDQHAVLWSLPELPAGQSGSVELTVLPVEVGTLAMTFQAMADLGVKAEARGELTVEEQAELAFTIDQDADPIELSASTTYTVQVRNVGRVDHQVQVIAQLPSGSKILKVHAPVGYSIQGDQLVFEPLPEMQSRAAHEFRFEVQHAQAGTQIVRAQLKSQNRPTPVIKEEATDVYNDRN